MKYLKHINEFLNTDEYDIKRLTNEIINEHPNCSALDIIYKHKNYKKIIKNGEKSIPTLLENIQESCGVFWYKALCDITGVYFDKTPVENRKFWKEWGMNNGY